MQFSLEIYVGAGTQYELEFKAHSSMPYVKPDVGEYVHPAWRIAEGRDAHPGERLQVDRVEHIYWEGHNTVLVFCREEPTPF